MKNKVYRRKNDGSVGNAAVWTCIKVQDGVIKKAWHDIPNGQWRGNEPTYLHGQAVTDEWLKDNGYS